jgi:hypothetical protein
VVVVLEMEAEKTGEEYSKEELRRQLYASLRSTGVLDSMKVLLWESSTSLLVGLEVGRDVGGFGFWEK